MGGRGPESGSVAEVVPALFRNYQVRDLAITEPDIEDVVRQIYEGRLDVASR